MKRSMWQILLTVIGVLLAHPVNAQTVVGPTALSFNFADASPVTGVQVDFFQCSGISGTGNNTVATGCATTPFQSSTLVPLSGVQTIPADQYGNTRQVSLTAAPVSGVLASIPSGVPFTATLIAVGDASVGQGVSPRSAASNPFFSGLKAVAAPATVHAK